MLPGTSQLKKEITKNPQTVSAAPDFSPIFCRPVPKKAGSALIRRSQWQSTHIHFNGGAENAGQDIAWQDNGGQEKHHAWVEIKT